MGACACARNRAEGVFGAGRQGCRSSDFMRCRKSAYDYAIGETKSTLAAILRIKENGTVNTMV